jgi:hypothetical protein
VRYTPGRVGRVSTVAAETSVNRHCPGIGSIEVAFTPGDRIDRLIIGEIDTARSAVLMHVYSFTDRSIARR